MNTVIYKNNIKYLQAYTICRLTYFEIIKLRQNLHSIELNILSKNYVKI